MTKTLDGYTYDYQIDTRYSPIARRSMQQLTVALSGGGCKYWLKTNGRGCTFCGFPGLTRLLNAGDGKESYFGGWRLEASLLERMYLDAVTHGESADKLAVFNGGSFFVDSELPPEFRRAMITDASRRTNFVQVMVESRPEYLTSAALDEAEPILSAGKDFVVGMGVESANDRVRNKLLKKGMQRGAIELAFRQMKRRGIKVFAYAFLKAPGLTEAEALIDARETISYLTDLGADEIALSCAFVPPNTPLETSYRAGDFRPPWLWTILQLIDEAKANGWPLSVGGFEDNPPPVAIASNCGKCDQALLDIIQAYRTSGITARSDMQCHCRDKWLDAVMTAIR